MLKCIVIVACISACSISTSAGDEDVSDTHIPNQALPTDNAAIDRFIHVYTDEIQGGMGQWTFVLTDRPIVVMTDEAANRMRIMTPVAEADALTPDDLRLLMEANFDKALDARYAIWRGRLWSAFIHPLGELSQPEFDAGLIQVVNLAHNYGTSYSSTDMIFGRGDAEAPGEGNAQPQPGNDGGRAPRAPL